MKASLLLLIFPALYQAKLEPSWGFGRLVYSFIGQTTEGTEEQPGGKTNGYRLELHAYGGHGYKEGNVYATNRNGYFGPVCDDGWGSDEARVVCKQLGYSEGTATTESYFGSVSTATFSMDNVVCRGSESYLQDCVYYASHYCAFSEAAGVKCSGQYSGPDSGGDNE